MGKLVTLNVNGGFQEGFSVRGEICQDVDSINNEPLLALASKSAHLPPHSDILEQYRHWQSLYTNLEVFFSNRLKSKAGFTNISDNDKNGAFKACKKAANLLAQTFNTWLRSSDFQPIEILLRNNLDKLESTRILLATENYGLRRLPWHEWDLLKDFPKAEISIASPNFQRVNPTKKLDKKDKVKILVILGDDAGTDADEKVIRKLIPDAEICWLIEPQRSELDEPLWYKSWDILFFAGHGKTKDDGTIGTIQINAQDVLTISEIKNHLQQAVKSGLKLAIFNSCDGLGLAYQLAEGEDLHLPQIIVMRENLPVAIAPKFLQYFLENYTRGLSLYSSLRESRQRLQILEKDFPCVSWLPVLCQNPAEIPPRWLELGGKIQISPYKGLSAFTENDTGIFFGRKVLTNSLFSKLERQKLLAIIGASGSGKSSLVAAGLIPQWLAQATEFLPRFVVKIRPGFPHPNPWENLAEELGKISPNLTTNDLAFLELVTNLEANSGELAKCLTAIVQEKNGCKILLVIDQFEELYTLCSEEKRRSFLAGLVDAVRDDSWKIVLTLRADFLSLVLDEDLGNIFDERDKLITPMNDEELTEAIALPAQKFEVEFADELINRMIQDYRQNSGHLPMLQFALEELWKKQKYGVISLASYEQIGGLTQVLGDYAEKIYLQLSQEEKEQARYIFTQLVQPISQEKSGEVSRIATRKIATFADIGKENWQLVIKFADERLVVTNKEKDVASVELIHEVLISAWSRLKDWIEQDWEFRRWQEKLRDNLSQWEQEKKDDFLLQGGLLKEAESWLEKGEQKIPEKERGYVEKSRKRREKERQKLISGLTGGLAIVSLFFVGAVWQWQRAERQSLINEVDSLSNLALNQFQSGEGGISALMTAMDAGQKLKRLVKDDEKLGNYPTTRPLLALQTITSNIREKNQLQANDSYIDKTVFTSDGKHIVSLMIYGSVQKIVIWNELGEKTAEWDYFQKISPSDLAISPDGKYIAIVNDEDKLYIYDFSGKKIADSVPTLPTLFGQPVPNSKSQVIFTQDSEFIAVVPGYINSEIFDLFGQSSQVKFFDLSGKEVKKLVTDGGGSISSLAVTPNGKEIVTGNSVGLVQVWNLKTFKKIREFKTNTGKVVKIDISNDGKRLLTLGIDASSENQDPGLSLFGEQGKQTVKLWDLSGKKIADIDAFPMTYRLVSGDARFSPDSQEIAIVFPLLGAIKFYDASSGKLIDQSTISSLLGFNLSYHPNGKTIAISGNRVSLLDKPKPNYFFSLNYPSRNRIAWQYDADVQNLIVIDGLNNIDIWNLQEIWNLREQENQKNYDSKKLVNRIDISKNLADNTENYDLVSITPNRKYIIAVTEKSIQRLDFEGDLIDEIKADIQDINSTSSVFSNFGGYSSSLDGSKIATIGSNIGYNIEDSSPVRLWNFATKQVKQLKSNSVYPNNMGVLVSPNGKYVLTIHPFLGGRGQLWDAEGNLLNPLDVNVKSSSKEREISALAILFNAKDEKWPQSGAEIIAVWQNSTAIKAGLKVGDRILEIDGNKANEFQDPFQFYPLLKGEPDTPVRLKVKNRNGNFVEKTILREKFIMDISNFFLFPGDRAKFSPDNQHLAMIDNGSQTLFLTNIKNKKRVEINNKAAIGDFYFSPNSKLIATIGRDYLIKIWDLSGKLVNQIKLEFVPYTLDFSPNSQQIAVLGNKPLTDNDELSIWSINGKQIAKYTVPEEQGNIVFSPDGKYIVTGQSKVLIWQNKNLNELLATGCDWLQEYLTTRPQEKEKFKVCQEEVK